MSQDTVAQVDSQDARVDDIKHDSRIADAVEASTSALSPEPLMILTARVVALAHPLDEIAPCLDVLPLAARRTLYAHMSHERLRGLEICWERTQSQRVHSASSDIDSSDDNDADGNWSLKRETEHEWHLRSKSSNNSSAEQLLIHSSSTSIGSGGARKRSFRRAFWEHRFRSLLRARAQSSGHDGSNPSDAAGRDGTLDDYSDIVPTLPLFQDVVRYLKVHGREVIPRNVALLSSLLRLERLEVHHPEQQRTCWRSLVQLVETHPSLAELCFFHGKLSDEQLVQLRCALRTRAASANDATTSSSLTGTTPSGPRNAIRQLELVSLKIRDRGHRELVTLLRECHDLTTIRLSNCLTGFENAALVATALQLPRLTSLALEHNELEDDALAGIAHGARTTHAPITLTHLTLDSNAIAAATLRTICTATLDGFITLRRLSVRNNVDVDDASIHALAPMLASSGVALTHLDLYNCSFGLEGATTLLLALGSNTSVTHVDVGHNFFGSSIGELLATFLHTNATLQSLRMNYVGLGAAGCTQRLRDALACNRSLVDVAFGANRLRDDGADVLFQALVTRSHMLSLPYASVDLSGNLLTHSGLQALANTVERTMQLDATRGDSADSNDEPRAKRQRLAISSSRSYERCDNGQRRTSNWIHELSLLDNNFPRDVELNERALRMLHCRVDVVRTNTWVGKRNVYDDEV